MPDERQNSPPELPPARLTTPEERSTTSATHFPSGTAVKAMLAGILTNAARRLAEVWAAVIEKIRSSVGNVGWAEFEKWGRRSWPTPIIISALILGIGIYNLCLAISASRTNRPNLIITDATLYINPSGLPPHELVEISLHNTGPRAASRSSATVFSVSDDGHEYEKLGFHVITTGPSSMDSVLGAFIGGGFIQIPIDMNKFLGRFLICVKYHDYHGASYKETFVFGRGVRLSETQNRLDELPSKHLVCPR